MDKHEIRVIEKHNKIVESYSELEKASEYTKQKTEILMFGKRCGLPQNSESPNTNWVCIDTYYKLIGMIERGELILNKNQK